MDVGMQDTLRRGKTLRELLRQGRLQHRDLFEQTVALAAVEHDWLAGLPTQQVRPFVERLCRAARLEMKDLVDRLSGGELLAEDWQVPLAELARRLRPSFAEQPS
jgi:F0F1-type ATP synthase alpha subunit